MEKAPGQRVLASFRFLTMLPNSLFNYLKHFFFNITQRSLDQLNYAAYEMMAVTLGNLELAPGREELFPLQSEDHVL